MYFMRKKWEIEDEYRKFCRNNKELALQTLRELTLTPTETGKEEQRIAYCMEWMKQQGMESVHTDELGKNLRVATRRMDCLQGNSTTAATDLELVPSPNLPKNEDSRQPQCPEDKESAIVEALKHFKMNS